MRIAINTFALSRHLGMAGSGRYILGLVHALIRLNHGSETDLPVLYAGADLFVYPSSYEGFGFPVLEAMACGTPVITSNISSLPEVAGDAGLLVDPLDVEALAGAMRLVLTDDDLRQRMRAKGLEQASRFTWEEAARRTLQLYEEAYALSWGRATEARRSHH